jgi:O-antigen ligase
VGRIATHSRWSVVAPLLAVAFTQAAVGLLQAWSGSGEPAHGSWVNRNHYAGFLSTVLPFALSAALAVIAPRARRPAPATARAALAASALFAGAAILVAAILLSLSRAGFVSGLTGVAVAAAVYTGRRSGRRRWSGMAATTLIVLSATVLLPNDALMARFSDLRSASGGVGDARGGIWRDAILLVRASPLLGCGFGAFESAFLRYKTVAPMHSVEFAHNDYLQCLIETGVLGLASLLLFFGTHAKSAASGVGASAPEEALLSSACLGSFAAMATHALADFSLYIPANGLLLAWVAGIAASTPAPRHQVELSRWGEAI